MTDISSIAPFSRVSLTWKGRALEGVITPGTRTARLKLDSGYTIGLELDAISDVQVLEAPPEKPAAKTGNGEKDPAKGSIMLIHTGGTIASKVDYETGAVYPSFSSEEILESYEELAEFAPFHARQISNIVSEDLRFSHINAIAREIHEHRDDENIDGFIVTHGTDTLHYTSAALSFILGGLTKPVIIVAAQRSSDRPSSDARLNLCSAAFAIREMKQLPPAVYVCMHESIHEMRCTLTLGLAARKMHSSRRDAFTSINRAPAASIDFENRIYEENPLFTIPQQEPRFEPLDEQLRVGVLVSRPNLFAADVEVFSEGYDGLVVEGSGFGHLPASAEVDEENGRILEATRKLAEKIPVVMTRRTISGVTNLNIYSPGRRLREAGVLGHGSDATPETTYIKLCWALSHHKDEVAHLMGSNVAGEHTDARDIE